MNAVNFWVTFNGILDVKGREFADLTLLLYIYIYGSPVLLHIINPVLPDFLYVYCHT